MLEECKTLPPPTMEGRTDLRSLLLLTIDPVDARDHDDAVHAQADSDPKNSGGWVVTVAIADVAHYIRPGSKIDREAQLRGNSVYFPDRVVPMLPEKISNDLCSLRELEERPCLAVRMIFDRHGEKRSHAFVRAMMRSAAKLSYQEAQAAIDGTPSDKCLPLIDSALKPLWSAYKAVATARDKRGPLDLDLPERKIVLDDKGRVERVVTPQRLDAHRLIEEFMIQANVAAAETLEEKRLPLVYRVHDAPSAEKLKGLRDFLETLDMKVPHAGALRPEAFNKVLAQAKDLPVPDLINEVILRSQSQAEYTPKNIGHFGLNLVRYAHFTSPIRRYADLLVHRALVRALDLGPDGLTDDEIPRLASIAKAISDTERRAMAAERETTDRLIAAHLADQVGAVFPARIAGVIRSGLFVRLKDTGADGYIPISSLGRRLLSPRRSRSCARRRENGCRISAGRHRRSASARSNPLGGCAAVRDADAAIARQRRIAETSGGGRPGSIGKRTSANRTSSADNAAATRLCLDRNCNRPNTTHMTEDISENAHQVTTFGGYPDRDAWLAVRRGWGLRCPSCGEGALYWKYLKVNDHVPVMRHGTSSPSRRRCAAVLRHDNHRPCRGRRCSDPREALRAARRGFSSRSGRRCSFCSAFGCYRGLRAR